MTSKDLDALHRARKRIEMLRRSGVGKYPLTFAEIQKQANTQKTKPENQGNIVPQLPQLLNGMRATRGISTRRSPNKINKVTSNYTPPVFEQTFQRQPYIIPTYTEISVPEWFKVTSDKIDVSIVIPMYRSRNEIIEQIKSWDSSDDGLVKEIIYISDACPQKSESEIVNSWFLRQQPVGKILLLSNNSGFATTCNFGANVARGKYIIFLNADTAVTKNWVKPMYDVMKKDERIGLVGNLQLKQNGLIDSAGSEWMWDSKSFDHIGRNVYNGKRLNESMDYLNAPEELKKANEREMVTGCCMMIPKKLFEEIGGFDIEYRIGYWEDAELNMQVHSKGYKVYYEPASVIYHKTGHSGVGIHPFAMDNVKRFYSRWVDNKKIDALIKSKRP